MSDAIPTVTPPQPKWWQSPLAKEVLRIALAAALAWLAAKGIHLPGELPAPASQPVVVYVGPGHDAAR